MIRPTSDYGADPARAQHDHRATTAAPGNRGQRTEETSSRAIRIEQIWLTLAMTACSFMQWTMPPLRGPLHELGPGHRPSEHVALARIASHGFEQVELFGSFDAVAKWCRWTSCTRSRAALSPTKVSKTMRRISSSSLDKSAHGYVNWN